MEGWTAPEPARDPFTSTPVELAPSVPGDLNDYERDPFPHLTPEERASAIKELPWAHGASEYFALDYATHMDAPHLTRLAYAEQASLELMAKKLKKDPLIRNLDFIRKYNRGDSSLAQRENVETRFSQVVASARHQGNSTDEWLENKIASATLTSEKKLPEEECATIGGFGLAALESDDFHNAELAFHAAGLMDDPRVTAALERKRTMLERSFAERTKRDDTHDYSLLKRFEELFGERTSIHRAA